MSDRFADELERALARAEAEATPEAELAAWRAMGPLVMRLCREHDAANARAELAEKRADDWKRQRDRVAAKNARMYNEWAQLQAREQACREAMEALGRYAEHRPPMCPRSAHVADKALLDPCTCGLDAALALLAHARSLGRSGG